MRIPKIYYHIREVWAMLDVPNSTLRFWVDIFPLVGDVCVSLRSSSIVRNSMFDSGPLNRSTLREGFRGIIPCFTAWFSAERSFWNISAFVPSPIGFGSTSRFLLSMSHCIAFVLR